MSFLIDTNLLLRSIDPSHSMNTVAVQALITLRQQGEQLCIVPQNLIEFWNVYTRPVERNGALLNGEMNCPPSPPTLGELEFSKPPELGVWGRLQRLLLRDSYLYSATPEMAWDVLHKKPNQKSA